MNYMKSDSLTRYFKSINDLDPLTKEEELELAIKAKDGDTRSINKLVLHNTKIVVTIANKNQGRGIEVDDLIQQGNEGLLAALNKYDPAENVRFATFAGSYILKYMNRLIDYCGRTVRIPVNQEYQRYLALKRGEEVENLTAVRLDDQVSSDEDSSTKGDRMFSVGASIEEEHDADHTTKTVSFLLDKLDDKERSVLELFYGVNRTGSISAKEISEDLGIPQAKVYNILKTAKKNLKQYV